MPKPVEIKRIDLLVHPFYEGLSLLLPYSKKQAPFLLEEWKKQIDEAAMDPGRLLLIVLEPKTRFSTEHKKETLKQLKARLQEELVEYAIAKMGKRIGLSESFMDYPIVGDRTITNFKGQTFAGVNDFCQQEGFGINSATVKTRGFGEYDPACIFEELAMLNKTIGMKKPIPYRNPQSAIIRGKSVGHYFRPWEIQRLLQSEKGKALLRRKAKGYIAQRRKAAYNFSIRLSKKK